MLQTFIQDIKPLNDQLGVSLGMKAIAVKQIHHQQEIRVNVTFKSYNGRVIQMPNTMIRDCRALGLML